MQNQEKTKEKIKKINDFAASLQVKLQPMLNRTDSADTAVIAYIDEETYEENKPASTNEQDTNQEV